MKGDRIEAVVDTGQGVQTFEITASRAGMTSRLIALVEHPVADQRGRIEVLTRHRLRPGSS